jgi:ribosomal protein L7/L12/outer membrane protein assembly factor BamB
MESGLEMDIMTQSFSCPNCSAPLDLDRDGSATIKCPYCSTSVIIPAELRLRKLDEPSSLEKVNTYNSRSDLDLTGIIQSIQEKAVAGDEIEAIRILRSTFVIGLKDAKDLVEAIQRGEEVDIRDLELVKPPSIHSASLDPSSMNRMMELILSGNKIEAIRLFRQSTGAGLTDSRDAVDAIEAALSAPQTEMSLEPQPLLPLSMNTLDVNLPVKNSRTGRNCLVTGFIIFLLMLTVIPILAGMTSQGGPLAGIWSRINPFAVGKVTHQFGQQGTGPGYFTDARFVSVDNNGHIFVGEFNGGRVQVFDQNGNYLTQWKATGEETGDIYLSGMAADRRSTVYVVVGSNLYVYDGMNGTLQGRLDHPDGWGFDDVTISPDGSVVAAWYKSRDDLIRFDQNGGIDLWVQNAIANVTGDSEMDMRVAVDGSGNIYDLAYFNESVFIFSPEGKYISRFGSRGDEDGQFTSPRSIAIDNLGKVYIADFPGVMIYASDGRYLDTLQVNGAVMGMTFDDQNNLYTVVNNQVLRFDLK